MRFGFHPASAHALALTAGLCGMAGAAHAQVQIYGTIDAAAGQVSTQPPGPPNAAIVRVRGVHNGALQTSYLGFRGSEDLGGGYTARFLIESFLRVDTGQNGRFDATPAAGPDQFWSRNAFVGLGSTTLGEVRLGNNANPIWISMLQTNALGANSVFSPSFRQLFNGGTRGRSEVDTALVNSAVYLTPVFGGVSATFALQAGEGSGTRYNYSGSVTYRGGPLVLTAATQSLRHAAVPNLPGARDQDMLLVGGAYDFGLVRAFAQYTTIANDRLGTKDKLPHVGLSAPIGAGTLQFGTGEDKTTVNATGAAAKRTTTSLGYVYSLSKRTDVYAFGMTDKVSVGTAKSGVVGISHRF
jgi:predicted porin